MVAENVKNIRQRITSACLKVGRKPEEVTLVAVTKTFGTDLIREVVANGVQDIGESYIQELCRKKIMLDENNIRWHFLGHLQSNKVKYIADWIHLIHSVDSLSLGQQISKLAAKVGREIDILVEMNTTGEKSKFGIELGFAPKLIKDLAKLPNVNVKGLMTMGPFLPDPEKSRLPFRMLRELQQSLDNEELPLPILSMGMTNDFEVAIEEGATMIRIGTEIFGSRTKDEW